MYFRLMLLRHMKMSCMALLIVIVLLGPLTCFLNYISTLKSFRMAFSLDKGQYLTVFIMICV